MVAVVVIALLSLQLFLHSKSIQQNALKSLQMSSNQIQLIISDKLRGYSTILTNIAESKAVRSFIVDNSDLNRLELAHYLNKRSLLEHKPRYSVLDFSHHTLWKSKDFSFSKNELSSLFGNQSVKKVHFQNHSEGYQLILVAPISYRGSVEGYIIAELPASMIFDDLKTQVGPDYAMAVSYGDNVISTVRSLSKTSNGVDIRGAEGLHATISVSEKLTRDPVINTLKILILSGIFVFLLSMLVFVFLIIPMFVDPFEQLGISISKLEKTEGQMVNVSSNILEVNILQDRFNKMLRKLDALYSENMFKAHKAGMAEISISVLHNIGNIVTGLNLKCHDFNATPSIERAHKLLLAFIDSISKHVGKGSLESFLQNDKKGSKYLDGMRILARELQSNIKSIDTFINFFHKQLNHMAEIISSQQNMASGNIGLTSEVNVKSLIEDALKLMEDRFVRHEITARTSLIDVEVLLNKYGFSQVIVNFFINSIESILERKNLDDAYRGEIHVGIKKLGNLAIIEVADNGMGIEPDIADKLFSFGFSTKNRQSGFGLHNCANFAKANGGKIALYSEGPLKGARSVLEFPLVNRNRTGPETDPI